MYILGISCYYHDASAALIKDGKILAAAEEERFTRKKHDSSFPIHSIHYCLRSQKVDIDKISAVCFYEKPFVKFERIFTKYLEKRPSYSLFKEFISDWLADKKNLQLDERWGKFKGLYGYWCHSIDNFGKLYIKSIIKNTLKYNGKIYFCTHHQAHAASSFFTSPYNKAAILTIDGVGEWSTTTYGYGESNKIHLLKDIKFPHSLGLLYSTITAYLGFSVNNSEYKVMGLSAYGNMNKATNEYYKKLKQVIDVKEDGSFRLEMKYFDYINRERMPSEELCRLLGGPASKIGSEITSRHKDIAAALQMITEEVLLKLLNHVYNATKCKNLCLAGGVALNSVANGKILKNTPFESIFIQPAAGDGGASIGAAYFCYNHILGNTKREIQKTAYLGPEYSDDLIKFYLDLNNIKYYEFKNKRELIKETARLIYKNKVIGWFQGRMEWGPRALGARSILSNPCNKKMSEILNLKVKHRERFRPFAPVVCRDDALKYFECDEPIPLTADFMLMVYPIRKKYRVKIPAVTHVDGSGRLQTIRRDQNPDYYDLIKKFGKLSGIPMLINTSFNIRGEPIVCTPDDAYRCMMGTGIDYLAMGKFLIKRSNNPKDYWHSESFAKD